MFILASQLRSILSPQRSLDRPLPPFSRRDQPPAAKPLASRYDVTESRAIQTNPRIERLPAMTLCKFYQQGNCKFGNSCRFEHAARNQPPNRFGALAAGAAGASGHNEALAAKYNISADVIEKDLTVDKPQWILSAYAPGRDAPEQLFGGYPREQSFEELRLHYVVAKASGNERQALEAAQSLYGNARQQMEAAVRNVHEAARFIADGEKRHPNRHDVCRERTQGAPFGEFLAGRRPKPMADAQANPFASGANASSAFGQPASSFGQSPARPNPFGAPAFGQPAQPAAGVGQPPPSAPSPFGPPSHGAGSAFGQGAQPASAFGQPSALGAKPNPFGAPSLGQPAQPSAQGNAFGQPAQPSTQGTAFGQPAQPSTQGNAFGQPSQLGHKPNPFASNATTTGADPSPFSTIGTTGNSGSNNAPAANPFGAPSSSQAVAPNPFSTNSTNQNSNAFGQAAQSSASPFAQASAPASNPFASANQQQVQEPFGQKSQAQTNGAFGQPTNHPSAQNAAQNAVNPFGQQPDASQPTPFGAPQTQQKPAAASAGNPYPPGSTRQHPPLESYSSRSMDGRLTMFKGKPVTYKNGMPGNRAFDGTWTRIWFPNGPPGYCTDTELPPESYDETSKAQWEAFVRTGTFADGIMPQLPPPRECTLWDF